MMTECISKEIMLVVNSSTENLDKSLNMINKIIENGDKQTAEALSGTKTLLESVDEMLKNDVAEAVKKISESGIKDLLNIPSIILNIFGKEDRNLGIY